MEDSKIWTAGQIRDLPKYTVPRVQVTRGGGLRWGHGACRASLSGSRSYLLNGITRVRSQPQTPLTIRSLA